MIGAAEDLFADVAGLGVAPDRLVGRPRQTLALALGAQHQPGQRQVEGAGEPHQHHGGRADLGALDLADGGLGDAGAFGEIGQRPAAAVALQPQALGEAVAEIVY